MSISIEYNLYSSKLRQVSLVSELDTISIRKLSFLEKWHFWAYAVEKTKKKKQKQKQKNKPSIFPKKKKWSLDSIFVRNPQYYILILPIHVWAYMNKVPSMWPNSNKMNKSIGPTHDKLGSKCESRQTKCLICSQFQTKWINR